MGLCIYFKQYFIIWQTKKQHTLSRSSAEVEYHALAHTVANTQWLIFLFRELTLPLRCPPTLHCDNVSVTYLASDPVLHARSKHIEINYHFLLERVMHGSLPIVLVPREGQLAYDFTKGGLPTMWSKLLLDKLMILPCSPNRLKGC